MLDFGISKISDGAVDNLTKTTAAMGSASTCRPSRCNRRAPSITGRTFTRSASPLRAARGPATLLRRHPPQLCAEILTGTPTPIRSVRPEITEDLAQVIEKAYARDKGQRHQSVADLVIALAPYAPARSQQMIDRIARMAGLPIPVAGSAGQRASAPPRPSSSPSFPQQGGTQMMPQHYAPSPHAARAPQPSSPAQYAPVPAPHAARASQPDSPATEALPVMSPPASRPPPPGMSPAIPRLSPVPDGYNQIVPDHYQAPASSRASKHFRQGSVYPLTDGSMSAGHRTSQSGGGKAGMAIAILGVLLISAAATALLLRPRETTHTPLSGLPGPERLAETAAVQPPDTAPTAPPPVDVKSAPPAASASEPPARTAPSAPVGNGAKAPVKGAPVAHPPNAPTAPTAAPVVKPPVNPLDPGGRQGSLLGPTQERQT